MDMGIPVRLALLCAASTLAACGLIASGTSLDGGVDPSQDASLDARRDGNGGSADATLDATGDDASDAGPDVREAGCPTGLPGPTMVKVDEYCIDSTEVTNEQFDQFLNATADAGTPPMPCDWATGANSYRFYTAWITGYEKRPAANMNWCGAAEYCRWAKKRLCGKRGGGGNLGASSGDAKNATKSEWFNACSKGGTQPYPYGSTYSATACNAGTGLAANVSASPTCEGGYPGLYDMVGNVIEWQDACETNGNPWDQNCIWQGGSSDLSFNSESKRRCDQIDVSNSTERSDRWYDVGFRCCADPQ